MRAPIVSRKHIVQKSEFSVVSASVTSQIIVRSVAIQDVDILTEVQEGSVIKAVYIEMWLLGKGAIQSTFVVILEKVPAGAAAPTFTQMTTLDAYPNKKNILFTSQGLVGDLDSNPTPVLRQWLKIPKGKQRFGLEDELRLNIAALGANDLNGCGLFIYKSYT